MPMTLENAEQDVQWYPWARACAVMAVLSLSVGVFAWLPLEQHPLWLLFPMGFATWWVVLCVWFQIVKAMNPGARRPYDPTWRTPLPRHYGWYLATASVAFLAMFADVAGMRPLENKHYLRVFAATCLLLNISGVWFAQWSGKRLRDLGVRE